MLKFYIYNTFTTQEFGITKNYSYICNIIIKDSETHLKLYNIMDALDFFKVLFSDSALVRKSSFYHIDDEKMVRISDHLPQTHNLIRNEDAKEMLFVFVNSHLKEIEIERACEEIANYFDIEVDYLIYEDEEDNGDTSFVEHMVNRFLNR